MALGRGPVSGWNQEKSVKMEKTSIDRAVRLDMITQRLFYGMLFRGLPLRSDSDGTLFRLSFAAVFLCETDGSAICQECPGVKSFPPETEVFLFE